MMAPELCPAQLVFGEKYADKVVGIREGGETYFEQFEGGNFTARFKFAIPAGFVPDAETPVEITIGDWSYRGFFGDDPKYRAGAFKANIPLYGGKLSLTVSSSAISGSVVAKTGARGLFDNYEDSPAARNLAGQNRVISSADSLRLNFSIDLSQRAWIGTSSVSLSGAAATKMAKRGPRDFPEEFELSRVKVGGSASVVLTPPPPDAEP